ncbi:hypothetical protein [Archangium violaceum]|uniref:Lipoprotein n=1 Tax=Archangium violaceum Cb vi76 TaxID=1406225 RepID=A0A084SWV7_9BACT|nr:hypothetical protein [Archangium violaceum]KFA92942.1 hypothetical protein Q664_11645 [Archangium violaceum Cb vi76]
MTRSKFILAGLIAGAMAFGTACKSDKAAEMPPADPSTTESTPPPATDEGGTTMPPAGTGGAGMESGVAAPIPDTGVMVPEDYGGSGEMNPENPGTGGSGDIIQDDEVRQDDVTLPDSMGGSGLQDDEAAGGAGTPDPDATQRQDEDTQDKAKDNSGTGGSGLEDDQRFEGDSFPSDSERVNEPVAPPPAGAPVPTP